MIFSTELGADLRQSKFEEQLQSVRAAYETHLLPSLEGYAFMERFQDSFMSIAERYEVGGGLKFEWEVGKPQERPKAAERSRSLTKKGRDLLRAAKTLDSKDVEKWFAGRKSDVAPPPAKALAAFRHDVDESIVHGIWKRYAVLSTGLAVTIMTELERAEIATVLDSLSSTGEPVRLTSAPEAKIGVDAQRRVRLVLRPSLALNLSDALRIEARSYFKGSVNRLPREGERYDYRVDSGFAIAYSPRESGSPQVGIEWSVDEHYDSTPPELSAATLASYAAKGLIPRDVRANRRHIGTQLKAKIKW